MKKREIKLISIIISFLIIFSISFVFAGEAGTDEEVIASISNSILDVMLWVAYVIALGVLLMSGIKYMMSGANEKANVKGMLPKYIIGIIAITSCFMIAKFFADIAGNDTAEEIVDVSSQLGINYVESTDLGGVEN